jgi:hypothetical protein
MIPALMSSQFAAVDLDGSCCIALLEAKHRALAILHDCPHTVKATTQHFNKLTTLPDAADLIFRQAGPEEWLACSIKALIDADSATVDRSGQLERYAAKALEQAGRTLKSQQSLQDGYQVGHDIGHEGGYQEHVEQAATELETHRQKAEKAKAAKGEKTRQAVIECHGRLVREKGLFTGIDKAVAKEVGVSASMVSKILNKKK